MRLPRLRIDIVIAVAALVVSAASLITIIRHAVIMEKMLAADTLPFLELESGNVLDDQAEGIYYQLRNNGVGPARVETFQIFYDGAPVEDWHDVLTACCGLDPQALESRDAYRTAVGFLVSGSAAPAMVPEGGERSLLRWERDRAAPDLYEAFDRERERGKISARACYCSVFDECWITDFRALRPRSVRTCEGVDLKSETAR